MPALLVNFILTLTSPSVKVMFGYLNLDLVLNFKVMNLKCLNSKSINYKIPCFDAFYT